MRLASFVVLMSWVLSAMPGTSRADTYPRQLGIDAQHYAFSLTLSDDTDEITGQAVADILFVKEGLTEFSLDLATAANGKGMTVSAVIVGGEPVTFQHVDDRLKISLAMSPKAGERRQFNIVYHGVPAGGLRIGLNKYKERTFFGLNWPDKARQWLPIIDHPYDKATSEFIITAPAKYQVVANGLLQEERDLGDGRRLTHWKQSVPIASWLNAIGVAQFFSHHAGTMRGIPLQTWVYHQDRDAGIVTFEEPARRAFEFYSEFVAPYPYEKLANVQAAGLGGGTEHASVIFYGETSVTPRPATDLVAHEIAHQWFGNSVTEADWDDVWLSEGFATYFTLLCTEHYEGRDAFVAGLTRSRTSILSTERRMPGQPVVHNNLSNMRGVLNQFVYQKGAWTLHMLRGQIGTSAFHEGIQKYYHKFQGGNASTDDLRKVMEQVSGQDLAWFFHQWLNRAGSPSLHGGWRYDPLKKSIEIDLEQAQEGEPMRLPLEVGISFAGGKPAQIQKIEFADRKQHFGIPISQEPAAVVLDPNTWMLMSARFDKLSTP